MANVHTTTDHDEIREWVEDHGGEPAIIDKLGAKSNGILYVDFHTGLRDNALKDVSWDEFFDAFEENSLAFIYRETKGSHFFKFVARDGEDEAGKDDKKEGDEDETDPNKKKNPDQKMSAELDEGTETSNEDAEDEGKKEDEKEGMGSDDEAEL